MHWTKGSGLTQSVTCLIDTEKLSSFVGTSQFVSSLKVITDYRMNS